MSLVQCIIKATQIPRQMTENRINRYYVQLKLSKYLSVCLFLCAV